MNRRTILFMLIVCCAAALIATLRLRALRDAHHALDAAQQSLDVARDQVRELIRLRDATEKVALNERPPNDIIARINTTLADVGLPAETFRQLDPVSTTSNTRTQSATSPQYQTQSARILLSDLEPPELGRFLDRWRTSQPLWTITRIELTHPPPRNSPRNPRNAPRRQSRSQSVPTVGTSNNSYDIALVLTAVHLADN